MGLKCLALTGKHTEDLIQFCDEVISIPAKKHFKNSRDAYIMYGQMLCNAIEFKLNLAPLVKEEE